MATQAATSGGLSAGVIAFGVAAATLVLTLVAAAMIVGKVSDSRVSILRTVGPRFKRVGGVLLIVIATWFVYLAAANPTYLLS